MSAPTCPRRTPWCTEHDDDNAQCVSPGLHVAAGCCVWLLLEIEGLEPVVVVDAATSGADLTLTEAEALAAALGRLRAAAEAGTAVGL